MRDEPDDIFDRQEGSEAIMYNNVAFFGQHYFHNVDRSEAKVDIMKIMLTKKSDHYCHSVTNFFRP